MKEILIAIIVTIAAIPIVATMAVTLVQAIMLAHYIWGM